MAQPIVVGGYILVKTFAYVLIGLNFLLMRRSDVDVLSVLLILGLLLALIAERGLKAT